MKKLLFLIIFSLCLLPLSLNKWPVSANSHQDLITNGDFEAGASTWVEQQVSGGELQPCVGCLIKDFGTLGRSAHTGSWGVKFGGGSDDYDKLIQNSLVLPSNAYSIIFMYHYDFESTNPNPDDFAYADIHNSSTGEILTGVSDTYTSSIDEVSNWTLKTHDITPFKGQTIDVEFYLDNEASPDADTAFYIDDVSILALFDNTLPTGSISANSNATYSTSPSVTLTLTASDTGSGLGRMRFSNDNSHWCDWQSYATSATWSLTNTACGANLNDPQGLKTIYAQFQDRAENNSSVYSDSIIYDSVSPEDSIVIENNAFVTTSQIAKLDLVASDEISGLNTMRLSNDNSHWTDWIPYSNPYNWDLTNATYGGNTREGYKSVYVVYKDKAGNMSYPPQKATIIYNPRNVPIVSVVKFHYNAKGLDKKNLNDEYVVLKNNLNASISITNWTIVSRWNKRYKIPSYSLKGGAVVAIRSGKGNNKAPRLYMKRKSEFWNNKHDRIKVYNTRNQLITTRAY